jgi:hypothetical protein
VIPQHKSDSLPVVEGFFLTSGSYIIISFGWGGPTIQLINCCFFTTAQAKIDPSGAESPG